MHTIGIDPGLSGAIALLDDSERVVWCEDMPVVMVGERREIDGNAVALLFLSAPPDTLVAIERVPDFMVGDQARSRQVARLHAAAGLLRGIAIGFALEVREMTPQQWRGLTMPTTAARRRTSRAAGVTTKQESLAAARRRFPTVDLHLEKHDGRAEALLIAVAGRYLGPVVHRPAPKPVGKAKAAPAPVARAEVIELRRTRDA
jgi:hypothetical protein